MAISKIMQIVKGVATGNAFFNDCLSDGTRSIKVWGWGEQDYTSAIEALQAAGYQTKLVKSRHGRRRLHVTPSYSELYPGGLDLWRTFD